MSVTRRLAVCALSALCLLVACTASAAEFSRYREFDLGISVSAVTAVTQTAERDLKTLHAAPALLQEVVWQPRYMRGSPVADRGSIHEMVFSFVDDRLFRMTVAYDRSQTTGLTNSDMIAALTDVYGDPRASRPQSRASADAVDGATALAEWTHDSTRVVLQRTGYNESFSLVITSLPLETVARTARTAAVALEARNAPAREAALAKKRADEQRLAEEQVRTTNKKVFKP
jgi:hypothetical protein